MNPITQQAALAFLTKVHHGSCSVPADSPFGHTFAALAAPSGDGLQVRGEVELRLSATVGYVDVYAKGYTNGRPS